MLGTPCHGATFTISVDAVSEALDLVFGQDADHIVEGPFEFVSISWGESFFHVLRAKARRTAQPNPARKKKTGHRAPRRSMGA